MVGKYGWVRVLVMSVLLLAGCAGDASKKGSDGASGGANSQEELLKGIVTAKPPETPESLAKNKLQLEANLELAKQAAASGDLEKSIKLLEDCVMLDAKHRDVLLQLINCSRDQSLKLVAEDPAKSYGRMVQAGVYLGMLQEAHNDFTDAEKKLFAGVYFDLACAHARSQRREEFTGSFNTAIGAGFSDIERLKSDPDLEAFRQVPHLKELMDQAIESIAKRQSGT